MVVQWRKEILRFAQNAIGVVVVVFAMFAASAEAEPHVKAYVDRTTVMVLSPFLFTIEVSGSNITPPQIPDIEGLKINRRPAQSSSVMHFEITGSGSSMVTDQRFGYYAQATRVGKITIPPISIQVSGQTFNTQPILLTVTDSGTPSPQAPQPPGRPGTLPQQPPSVMAPGTTVTRQSREPTWEDVVFIESTVDKKQVYQGEMIQLSLSLWRLMIPGLTVGTYHGQDMRYPTSEGFYATTLQPTRTQKQRNGFDYDVTVYPQLLYPTATGDLRIGSWHWEGGAMYGFQRQNFSFDTPPIDINVKPLPERPADFSGAVGSFTARSQLMRNQVVQGSPTQLVVRVTGRGNPDAIGAPVVPKIEDAYVSDPEKSINPTATNDGDSVEKTFTYTITPHKAGTLTIPEIAFCYFDPLAHAYKTEKTNAFTVNVLPSSESSSRVLVGQNLPGEQGRVDVIGEDILPIITAAVKLRPSHPSPATAPVVLATPVLAYCGLFMLMRRKRRFERDTGLARAYTAKSRLRKRLKQVPTAAEPSEELYRALLGFVADKLNIPEAGMTSADAKQALEAQGVAADLVENYTKILRACERARYASVRLSDEEMNALAQAADIAMDRLDETLKRDLPR
jgi:hypothetical protein